MRPAIRQCRARPRQFHRQSVRQQQQSPAPPGVDIGPQSGTFRTVCVRTCDGAYFPVSFATYPARFPDDEKTCKALCPATEATLFAYRNPGEDINQAVSISGQPYTSLPNAFKYRTEFNPSCACKAAGQTWSDALKSVDDKAAAEQQGDIIVTEESAKKMQQRAQPQPRQGGRRQEGRQPPRPPRRLPAPGRQPCARMQPHTRRPAEASRSAPSVPTFIPPRATNCLAVEHVRRRAARARDQFLVGRGQRLAVVAKAVGDGIAAVAAEILLA